MIEDKLIFLDTELGGAGSDEFSLLTAYFIVLDENLQFIDDLYLYLKPDSGIYHVSAAEGTGLDINKIDLVKHDKMAITYKEGGKRLYEFLNKHSDQGKTKLTPVGHGIYGDVERICKSIISKGTWDMFASYRKIDTQGLVQFLRLCNLFPVNVGGSLESISKHFDIPMDKNTLHDAKIDTMLCVEVFKKLKQIYV